MLSGCMQRDVACGCWWVGGVGTEAVRLRAEQMGTYYIIQSFL